MISLSAIENFIILLQYLRFSRLDAWFLYEFHYDLKFIQISSLFLRIFSLKLHYNGGRRRSRRQDWKAKDKPFNNHRYRFSNNGSGPLTKLLWVRWWRNSLHFRCVRWWISLKVSYEFIWNWFNTFDIRNPLDSLINLDILLKISKISVCQSIKLTEVFVWFLSNLAKWSKITGKIWMVWWSDRVSVKWRAWNQRKSKGTWLIWYMSHFRVSFGEPASDRFIRGNLICPW
jgi:hypothetical protein